RTSVASQSLSPIASGKPVGIEDDGRLWERSRKYPLTSCPALLGRTPKTAAGDDEGPPATNGIRSKMNSRTMPVLDGKLLRATTGQLENVEVLPAGSVAVAVTN